MKSKSLLLFFLFTNSILFSQTAQIHTLFISGIDTSHPFELSYKFLYPYYTNSNKSIQDSINLTIMNETLYPDSFFGIDSNSIKKCLNEALGDGLTDYSFNWNTYKNLLAVDISIDAYAAYPTSNTFHFTFDTKTGHRLSLKDLARKDKIGEWRDKLMHDLRNEYNAHIIELENRFIAGELDSIEVNFGYSEIKEYIDELTVNSWLGGYTFYVEANTIIIPSFCEFPRVFRALEPYFKLTYKIEEIKTLLRPEFYRALKSKKKKI